MPISDVTGKIADAATGTIGGTVRAAFNENMAHGFTGEHASIGNMARAVYGFQIKKSPQKDDDQAQVGNGISTRQPVPVASSGVLDGILRNTEAINTGIQSIQNTLTAAGGTLARILASTTMLNKNMDRMIIQQKEGNIHLDRMSSIMGEIKYSMDEM